MYWGASGVSVGHVFVRVFVSVFVGVFVWVGFCITQFNLERMLQLWIDVLDLIKHWSASQVYYKEHTISDLHMCKNGVCEVLVWRMWCVVDVVRGEWMWSGVDVVCV